MMALLQATAGLVEYGKLIFINPKPTGIHDKTTGFASSYVNNMISLLNINVTLIGVERLGTCDPYSRTCDGIRGLLQSGRADFSINPMEANGLDPELCFPHDYGPMTSVSETFVTQFPEKEAERWTADVFKLLLDVSPMILVLLFLAYSLMLILINIGMSKETLFGKIYSPIDLWQHMMMHPHKNFKSLRRRMILGQ